MKLRILCALVVTLAALNGDEVLAQAGGFDFSNFDPAQIQKRIMEGYRQQLEITDDAEWNIVEQRIQKVMDARRELGFGGAMSGMARMFGGGVPRGGGPRSSGFSAFLPKASAEEEALSHCFDAKASKAELKAALARFIEARKRKQANLEKAQAELREVLSVRQEVGATLSGLL